MKKLLALFAAGASLLAMLPGAQAGPGPHGITSDNMEHVAFVPFEVGTATGANFFDEGKSKYMVITGWKTFSIYDITDPAAPEQLSQVPFGFKFENEDVATNGEIMLFSESTPQSILHIWNIEDKSNPVEIATVPGAGDHTTSCLLDCKWSWGSSGHIVDLRKPASPKLMDEKWGDGDATEKPGGNNAHDITEVAPGLVLTSTNPMMFMDARKDPVHPKVLAVSEQMPAFVHSNLWPRKGKDDFALSTGETWTPGNTTCSDADAGLSTWDTTTWKKSHTLKKVDTYVMKNGTFVDGNPAVNAPFGCSSHWFTTHPKWHNGGLVAAGFYNHGTRILEVNSKGKISEIGYFLPNGGGTSGAYWIDNEYIYAVDYQRGLDILRFTGKV